MEDIENSEILDNVEVKEEKPSKSGGFGFRYLDPACSGIAYYSVDKAKKHPQSNCRNCGAVLGDVYQENFIPLTEEEKERLS